MREQLLCENADIYFEYIGGRVNIVRKGVISKETFFYSNSFYLNSYLSN